MCNQLPAHVETDRLLIKVARPEDARVLNDAVLESLPQLAPWLSWVHPAPALDQSAIACRTAYARYLLNEELRVLLFLRATGELVGGSGLHHIDWALRHFEVGYWARTRFCGQGLITEAVNALASHALRELGASRVYLTTDARNIRSCRVAERAGFKHEGTLRNARRGLDGQLGDTRIYSRIPGDCLSTNQQQSAAFV